jgi:hypothetical protein
MEKENRLIDANTLSDEVDKSKHNNPHPPGMVRVNHRNEHEHFLRMIYDAPTVDAVRWIPVTERLPEVGGSYIVVVKYKYDYEKEYDYDVDVATYYPYDNPDAYIDNRWDTYNDWDEGQQYIHITHWMPLPKPPKE